MFVCVVRVGRGVGDGSFIHTSFGEGIVAVYAVFNPFLLNKICLNQI